MTTPSMRLLAAAKASGGGGTPTLDTATEWWSPSYVSGSTITGQQGAHNLTMFGDSAASTSGIYNTINTGQNNGSYLDGGDILDMLADYTLVFAFKLASTAGTQVMQSKREGSNNGFNFFTDGGSLTFIIDTGPASLFSVGTASTALTDVGYGRDGATQFSRLDGGTRQTLSVVTDSSANSVEFRFGRGSGVTGLPASMEWYGAAVWQGTALTDAEIDDAIAELLSEATT